jgi:predicted anti-sigma-YlaC factor YlaD
MKALSCPQEAVVTNSARTGCWDNSMKEHVKGCPYCREIVQAVEWMKRVSGVEEKYLPDAEQVWLNARMLAMQEAQERVVRPLAIALFAVKATLMLALLAGIIWIWFGFQSLAAHSIPNSSPVPQSVIAAGIALATSAAAFLFIKLFQPILIEE